MRQPRKITIAGGGLAGLSLGIALRRRGVPVELHEAGSYPRHRVCGEFISGLTDDIAQRLGIAGALADALLHRSTAWFVRDRHVLKATLPEPARAISRHRLDLRLRDVFLEAGGDLRENSRQRTAATEGVVWTAGRSAARDSQWLGLKAHFHGYPLADGLEMHAGEGAYLGITPVEDGNVNVCGLFRRRADAKGTGTALLLDYLKKARLVGLADRLRATTPNPESFTGVSAIAFGRQSHADDVCALGDAGWMIPPFTGNGMTMAFESADTALPHVLGYVTGETDWRTTLTNIQAALRDRFKPRVRYANLLHPFLYTNAGQSTLSLLSKARILPFSFLYRALR